VCLRVGEIDGFGNRDITSKRLAAEERALAGKGRQVVQMLSEGEAKVLAGLSGSRGGEMAGRKSSQVRAEAERRGQL
jgi:hypothetical protein